MIHENRKKELIPILEYFIKRSNNLHCVGGIVYKLNIGRDHVEKDWKILKKLQIIKLK